MKVEMTLRDAFEQAIFALKARGLLPHDAEPIFDNIEFAELDDTLYLRVEFDNGQVEVLTFQRATFH